MGSDRVPHSLADSLQPPLTQAFFFWALLYKLSPLPIVAILERYFHFRGMTHMLFIIEVFFLSDYRRILLVIRIYRILF